MSYIKHNWINVSDPNNPPDGATPLDANTLSELDDGIAEAYTYGEGLVGSLLEKIKATQMVIKRQQVNGNNYSHTVITQEESLGYDYDLSSLVVNDKRFDNQIFYYPTITEESTPFPDGTIDIPFKIHRPTNHLFKGHGFDVYNTYWNTELMSCIGNSGKLVLEAENGATRGGNYAPGLGFDLQVNVVDNYGNIIDCINYIKKSQADISTKAYYYILFNEKKLESDKEYIFRINYTTVLSNSEYSTYVHINSFCENHWLSVI